MAPASIHALTAHLLHSSKTIIGDTRPSHREVTKPCQEHNAYRLNGERDALNTWWAEGGKADRPAELLDEFQARVKGRCGDLVPPRRRRPSSSP
jgi:hypothetical protein